MKLNKTKKRIKKFFTAKPKSDFWMWAFISLFIFDFFSPKVLPFMIMFQLGLVTPPEQDNSLVFERMGNNLAESFTNISEKMFLTGQNIQGNNPLVGKIIFFLIGHIAWVIWMSIIILGLQFSRYLISYIYRKSRKKGDKNGRSTIRSIHKRRTRK